MSALKKLAPNEFLKGFFAGIGLILMILILAWVI